MAAIYNNDFFEIYGITKLGKFDRAYEYVWILLMLLLCAEEDELLAIDGEPLDSHSLSEAMHADEPLVSEALVALEAFDFIEKYDGAYYINSNMLQNRISTRK